MSLRQLRLVSEETGAQAQTATERVFAHWVFMLGKNPRRCVLGPVRRKAIDRALSLYDEETLLLAVEGCAASAWHAGDNDRDQPFNDIELILRDEKHIERFADEGERVRRLAQRAARELPVVQAPVHADPAEAQRQREVLRATAARLAGRALDRG